MTFSISLIFRGKFPLSDSGILKNIPGDLNARKKRIEKCDVMFLLVFLLGFRDSLVVLMIVQLHHYGCNSTIEITVEPIFEGEKRTNFL